MVAPAGAPSLTGPQLLSSTLEGRDSCQIASGVFVLTG
jgi:hypothetical protein